MGDGAGARAPDGGGIFLVIILVLAIAFIAGSSFLPQLRQGDAMKAQAQTADDVDLLLAVKARIADLVQVAARETPNALVSGSIDGALEGPLGTAIQLDASATLELAGAGTFGPKSEADLTDPDDTYTALPCLPAREPCVDLVAYDGADDGILHDEQKRIIAVAMGMVINQGERHLAETFLVQLEGIEL